MLVFIKHKTPMVGFTIVELLIAVVVIAILAAITIVSYNGMQTRAQASAASTGLRQIDKSMRLWATENSLSQWPNDPITGGGVPLGQMINDYPSLKNYLQQVPSVDGIQTDEWFYDNEGDTKNQCGSAYPGVNIVIRYMSNSAVALQIDEILDDGNVGCGKVRYQDQILFYNLNYTPTII